MAPNLNHHIAYHKGILEILMNSQYNKYEFILIIMFNFVSACPSDFHKATEALVLPSIMHTSMQNTNLVSAAIFFAHAYSSIIWGVLFSLVDDGIFFFYNCGHVLIDLQATKKIADAKLGKDFQAMEKLGDLLADIFLFHMFFFVAFLQGIFFFQTK
ncbi:hypothetical protein ACJX0J_022453 [Zea mays]